MTKEIDYKLFEYEPKDADEQECYEYMAESGVKPEEIMNAEDRARYVKFLEKFNADAGQSTPNG